MTVPDQVAVMPLPNAILFPRVLLPLYIFEPRYRQMLADCLQGDRMFAVALARDAATEQPCRIGGVGLIRSSVLRPDGTSNLILEGFARVEFTEYTQLRPYRLARVTQLDGAAAAPAGARAGLVTSLQQFARARAKLGADLPKSVLNSLLAVEDAGHMADLISYSLIEDCQQKQNLLETLDVAARLDQLVAWLQRQIQQLELWKTLQGDLPNADVGKN